jgi:hypothetical protein
MARKVRNARIRSPLSLIILISWIPPLPLPPLRPGPLERNDHLAQIVSDILRASGNKLEKLQLVAPMNNLGDEGAEKIAKEWSILSLSLSPSPFPNSPRVCAACSLTEGRQVPLVALHLVKNYVGNQGARCLFRLRDNHHGLLLQMRPRSCGTILVKERERGGGEWDHTKVAHGHVPVGGHIPGGRCASKP